MVRKLSKNFVRLGLGLLAANSLAHAGVPILGDEGTNLDSLSLKVMATQQQQLSQPTDLGINPVNPQEIFVVNRATDSAVVLTLDSEQSTVVNSSLKNAPGNHHFLANPSGIAFADNGFFATSHDENERTQPTTPADFMGPTLWTQSFFDGGHASHMDMLHNTPSGLGIAWVWGNAYFLVGGDNQSVDLYDFRRDHYAGGSDHTDGLTFHYGKGQIAKVDGVPSHLEFKDGLLYVADSGNNRILVLDPQLKLATSEDSFDYVYPKAWDLYTDDDWNKLVPEANYDGAVRLTMNQDLDTLIDGSAAGMHTPSGLAINDGVIYVGDFQQNKIFAFSLDGKLLDQLDIAAMLPADDLPLAITGLEFDAAGRLYIVDTASNRLLRLELNSL